MGGRRQDPGPVDLYLLVAFFAGPGGRTNASISKEVQTLTGNAQGFTADGTPVALATAVADWSQLAIADGDIRMVSQQIAGRQTAGAPGVVVTPGGAARLEAAFGTAMLQRDWPDVTERYLVARALGLPPGAGSQRLKRLDTAAGLRLAVVRRGWSLRVPESATVGQVRNALAARALAIAFGKPVEEQIGPNTRLSGKAGRTIAAQLLTSKRRVSSDAQLITALAAQHLETGRGDVRTLRQALLRRLFGFTKKEKSRVDPATLDVARSCVDRAPDARAFAKAVRSSAKLNANGWSGNRKAYISHVWRTVCDSYPDWRLSVETFKSMLTDAHREGRIVLVNADLRDKKNMRDVEDSATQYKNMEWHYVQIAD